MELQECLSLCEKLNRELKNACFIPEEKLSGEIKEALEETRKFQKDKFEIIYKEILNLEKE